jgi:hypothetical protein
MGKDLAGLREMIVESIKKDSEEYYRLLKNSQSYSIDMEDNPFFSKHDIYFVTIWDISIEMSFYVSRDKESGEISLLTENLNNFNSVAEKEDLNIGKDNAVDYVRSVIKLTRPYYEHVYIISDFGDIPYRGYLSPEVKLQQEKAGDYLAGKLHAPEAVISNDHISVSLFVLEAHTLERRIYSVTGEGSVRIESETVLDEVGFGY